jgi:hypothetical protein
MKYANKGERESQETGLTVYILVYDSKFSRKRNLSYHAITFFDSRIFSRYSTNFFLIESSFKRYTPNRN